MNKSKTPVVTVGIAIVILGIIIGLVILVSDISEQKTIIELIADEGKAIIVTFLGVIFVKKGSTKKTT